MWPARLVRDRRRPSTHALRIARSCSVERGRTSGERIRYAWFLCFWPSPRKIWLSSDGPQDDFSRSGRRSTERKGDHGCCVDCRYASYAFEERGAVGDLQHSGRDRCSETARLSRELCASRTRFEARESVAPESSPASPGSTYAAF